MNNIRPIRKSKKITQNQLAELTGLSRPYISALENDKWQPSQKVMIKISEALQESAEKIFFTPM